MSSCRRRWARVREEAGWLLGDLAALAIAAVLVPLLPLFFLFDDLREYHERTHCGDGPGDGVDGA